MVCHMRNVLTLQGSSSGPWCARTHTHTHTDPENVALLHTVVASVRHVYWSNVFLHLG